MLAAHSVPGCFHLLPKMHTPGSPGRPIVSSNNMSTENVLEFINYPIGRHPSDIPLLPEGHKPLYKRNI